MWSDSIEKPPFLAATQNRITETKTSAQKMPAGSTKQKDSIFERHDKKQQLKYKIPEPYHLLTPATSDQACFNQASAHKDSQKDEGDEIDRFQKSPKQHTSEYQMHMPLSAKNDKSKKDPDCLSQQQINVDPEMR